MATLMLAQVFSLCALGADWTVERPREGVLALRDDTGAWGGFSMGVAHQHRPEHQIRKRLDLAALPEGSLLRANFQCAFLNDQFTMSDCAINKRHTRNDALTTTCEDRPT